MDRSTNERSVQLQGTILGSFEDGRTAEDAVEALRANGFNHTHIGVISHDKGESAVVFDDSAKTAATGATIGLGTGVLWGLGVVGGILPAIGPAIAGGTLAAILSSGAVGAGAAGLGGALIGLGFGNTDAEDIEKEFNAGKIVVTVNAGERADVAREILERYRWTEVGAPFVDTHR